MVFRRDLLIQMATIAILTGTSGRTSSHAGACIYLGTLGGLTLSLGAKCGEPKSSRRGDRTCKSGL